MRGGVGTPRPVVPAIGRWWLGRKGVVPTSPAEQAARDVGPGDGMEPGHVLRETPPDKSRCATLSAREKDVSNWERDLVRGRILGYNY